MGLSAGDNISTTANLGVFAIDASEDDVLKGDLKNVLTFDHITAKKMLAKVGNEYKLQLHLTFIKN